MELWIRSQDRTFLRKVNTIGIVEGRDFWSIDENLTISFGKYKTKERTLEVLDEIQSKLKPQMVLSKLGNPIAETCDGLVYTEPNEYEIKELSTYVYEMPKE